MNEFLNIYVTNLLPCCAIWLNMFDRCESHLAFRHESDMPNRAPLVRCKTSVTTVLTAQYDMTDITLLYDQTELYRRPC